MGCYLPGHPGHLLQCSCSQRSGAVASKAKRRKKAKYAHLDHFVPVAVETLSAFGPEDLTFVRDLRQCIMDATQEPLSHHHLRQRIAVAVQRGNVAAILGSMGVLTWGWSPMLQFARLYISACSSIPDLYSCFSFSSHPLL